MTIANMIATGLLLLIFINPIYADDVKIVAAEFNRKDGNHWSVDVTLKHGDTGWDHYADNWRIVDAKGNILGNRVLYHPHVEEQPFTRSLRNVKVPESTTIVYVEAHDKVHGWTPKRLRVDLNTVVKGRVRVYPE
jgi:hypothetical protein